MDQIVTKRNEALAQKVIKGLESRNMSGYYAATKAEALAKALELIPEGSSIAMGGCLTAAEIGLTDVIKTDKYKYIDRNAGPDMRAATLAAFDADVFITSANAMTQDGVLINIDGNANRVAAIAFGPKKVVFIVGLNKVCADEHAAMSRARNVAAPCNTQRFEQLQVPCKTDGSCHDCKSPDTICCQFLTTRFSRHPGRIHVILVNDNLGF